MNALNDSEPTIPPSYRAAVVRHAAYIDALVDHTLGRDEGARSAFIRATNRTYSPLVEDEWPMYRDAYESKFGDCCRSYRALDVLRKAGAL